MGPTQLLACCMYSTVPTTLKSTDTGTNNNQQSNPEWFGVIYRELIPQSLLINATNAAKFGMKPSEIYKKSVLDAREVMCPPDQACEYVL